MAESTNGVFWGMHAGRTGEAEDQFLKGNSVALGWHLMGDLSTIGADRDAFKQRIASAYPAKTKLGVKLPLVEAQTHRRFLKTHLPVDALVPSALAPTTAS